MAHYLTFDNYITCYINDEQVTSGYELHDGDVIVAYATGTGKSIYVNTTSHSDGSSVDIYDSDIYVSGTTGGAVN